MSRVRRTITVRGVVQGVGFRPFVHHAATGLGLAGGVSNGPDGVRVDVEGEEDAVGALLDAIARDAPPLARVDAIDVREAEPTGATTFAIAPSDADGPAHAVHPARPPADVAPCDDCRRELDDPADRRAGYPFINCTACGPRFTIVRALPYDRARTTMASFALCDACEREYLDPSSRRFHAEPNACPRCGPRASFDDGGAVASGSDAIDACARALGGGKIVAIKGVGGYHLACDARDGAAVLRLRERKQRDGKPFALMARDVPSIEAHAKVTDAERGALTARERPIVLLARDEHAAKLAPAIAPGLAELGFMLPPSPLHHLLARACEGPLVMTSGNLHGGPIAKDDAEARERLGAVADAFLAHDRVIASRVDDSVVRVERGVTRILRRARGYAPDAVALSSPRPVIALGAELKSTFCLATGEEAIVSQHLGDLEDVETQVAWRDALASLAALLRFEPAIVACDLHPDLATTRFAESLGVPSARVQHHHAHVAACLAEHGRRGAVVAIVFDGVGHGEDRATWGGEIFVADLRRAERAAHLRYVRMPGGDAATRDPWRMALAYLTDAGEDTSAFRAPNGADVAPLRAALARGVASPWTSSAGRLFDAVASITGVRAAATFEGQAAMELEAASAPYAAGAVPYPYRLDGRGPRTIDLRAAVRAIAADVRDGAVAGAIGARFHATLAAAAVDVAASTARERGLRSVVLTGGCFQNVILARACEDGLAAHGLEVLRPARFPCNDGGISLGQAAVAAARMSPAETEI